MKVLGVREANGDRPGIDLHGQLTVLRGLDPQRRAWLIDVLGRVASPGDLDAQGEFVAHGIIFPLDRASRSLLDLDQRVRSVVRAEDLPGHDPRVAEAVVARDGALVRRRELARQISAQREALAAAVAERTAALGELDELRRGDGAAREAAAAADAARARLDAELASATEVRDRNAQALMEAVTARDLASEARSGAAERLERARQRRRSAMAAATAAAGALEQARPLVADDPTDELVARRAELASAERAAGEADPNQDSSPANRMLADLERRRVELVRLHEAVGDHHPGAIAAALDRLHAASTEAPPVVAALALADTWRDLHQQIAALDTGVSADERAAEERVAEARQAVVEAEVEYNQPVLTPEQIAKVEAAHALVLESQDRSEGRFGGSRQRKKLDDARTEERRVLERLGFSTYADYMMSSSSRGVGPANRSTLETARAQLQGAEDRLAALPGGADRVRRRVELLQRRNAVAPRVAALLGHEPTGPESELELRSLREPVAPTELAVAELATELGHAGVAVVGPPYDRDDVILLARFYLSEQESASARRDEIEQALAAIDAAIGTVRSARDRGEHEAPELDPLPELAQPMAALASDGDHTAAQALTLREARWAEVEAAREGVAAAEAAVAQHRQASADLTGLEAAFARCEAEERVAANEVAEAESEVAATEATSVEEAVVAAEEALARSTVGEDNARRAREEFSSDSAIQALISATEARVANGEHLVTEAAAAEQATAAQLAEVDAVVAAANALEGESLAESATMERSELIDDLDWELMARLAAVRSVGLAGSVPLVLDDPFAALDDDELATVLDRLVRLADAVQVVVVTERAAAVAWASKVGPNKALALSY